MTQSQIESWNQILPTRGKKQQEVLKVLFSHPEGLTAWEIAAEIDPILRRQDVAPRLTELRDAGLVYETGTSRMCVSGKKGEIYTLKEYWEKENAPTCR